MRSCFQRSHTLTPKVVLNEEALQVIEDLLILRSHTPN